MCLFHPKLSAPGVVIPFLLFCSLNAFSCSENNELNDPTCSDGTCNTTDDINMRANDTSDSTDESDTKSDGVGDPGANKTTDTISECEDCDDDNPCTEDRCKAGECRHTPTTDSCDDGDPCTEDDQCRDGVCDGTPMTCEDDNECTDDRCDEGVCVFENNTAPCDDKDDCTVDDTCSDGKCAALPMDCNDDNVCTDETCKNGKCIRTFNTDPCDDGSACTPEDICIQGICNGRNPVVCDDENACTDDSCKNDTCVHTPNNNVCNDGDNCTIGDTCQDGVCAPGFVMNCDDQNDCTNNSCENGKCITTPNSNPCDDEDECTVDDVCNKGTCRGAPMMCDDENECTRDTCSNGVCLFINHNNTCDDGDSCTSKDVCKGGICSGTAKDCNDDNECTEDYCQEGACISNNLTGGCEDGDRCTVGDICVDGTCQSGDPMVCEADENICTDEVCVNGRCKSVNNDIACDDADYCTHNDVCNDGTCRGTLVFDCDDGNPCTDDKCDIDGNCIHSNNTAPCEDGDLCTVNDVCADGVCQTGAPKDCDDDNVCTDESCNEGVCEHAPVAGACDDGNICTLDDTCLEGVCVGEQMTCEADDNLCTDEVCFGGRCISLANTAPCNDNDACTLDDICDEGHCTGRAMVCPDDNNPCTDERCVDGTCTTADNTIPCDDGNICTTEDVCVDGECRSGTLMVDCDPATCNIVTYTFQLGLNDYFGVTDSQISEASPDTNLMGETILSADLEDTYNTPDSETQILIKFEDIIGDKPGQIPLTATIDSATLSLLAENGTTDTISVHRMVIPWSNGTVWSDFDGIKADNTTALKTPDDISVAPTAGTKTQFNVTDALVAWQKHPDSNHGFVLLNDGTDGFDTLASENSDVDNRPALIAKVCEDDNLLMPLVNYPAQSSNDIVPAPTLEVMVDSMDGENLDVTFFGRKKGQDPWTLIVLPDTQYYAESYPEIFIEQAQWIIDEREAQNIQMVVHEGDLVNNATSAEQWGVASEAMGLLIEAELPLTMAPGNHDHEGTKSTTGSTALFSATFPAEQFEPFDWWETKSDFNENTNHFITLEIAEEDYLFIGLDFCPDEDEIAWADTVLLDHPDHKAVLTTHALLDDFGEYSGTFCEDTSYIFDDLITRHANLQLVLCGHMHLNDGEAYVATRNDAEKTVHQILADYQGRANGGNGLLRILTFFPADDKISVQTYSPYLDIYEADEDSAFILDYPMSGGDPFSQLGQAANVKSGTIATFPFLDLESDTTYEWYVEVSDGQNTKRSNTWRFTTAE